MEHMRQSRPDSGLSFQVNVHKPLEVEPASLGSGSACNRVHRLVRGHLSCPGGGGESTVHVAVGASERERERGREKEREREREREREGGRDRGRGKACNPGIIRTVEA